MRNLRESVADALGPSTIESFNLMTLGIQFTTIVMMINVVTAVAQGRSLLYVGSMLVVGAILVGFSIWCSIHTRTNFWKEWHRLRK